MIAQLQKSSSNEQFLGHRAQFVLVLSRILNHEIPAGRLIQMDRYPPILCEPAVADSYLAR
ncbi:hypothetical protein RBWH47_02609 [Rhodopirellula baltica WH47]|uniref:Uncharacterized protein n=1 Tax=Rhodopirellula baltica WH47 TaxID=991778 RepID=F2AZM8_RHOBT|nr:hypothetical protein RBWH47_02609 [Rhodopirellula baltica WH47]